jgi:hypothetical protein
MINYCFTLAYNLPSEVEKVTNLLYEQNNRKDFFHLIVDLGFPLVTAGEIPKNFEGAREINSMKLRETAATYGSDYVKFQNIGVSQNWTQVLRYINPADDDVLIGCDPDEHPIDEGWVKAMGDVLRFGNTGLSSLINLDQVKPLSTMEVRRSVIKGHNVTYPPDFSCAWALIGMRGSFMKAMGEVPVPEKASKYGWIEQATYPKFKELGFSWCFLSDYFAQHTVWNGPSVFQDWKLYVINNTAGGQISFEEYLMMKKEGKL